MTITCSIPHYTYFGAIDGGAYVHQEFLAMAVKKTSEISNRRGNYRHQSVIFEPGLLQCFLKTATVISNLPPEIFRARSDSRSRKIPQLYFSIREVFKQCVVMFNRDSQTLGGGVRPDYPLQNSLFRYRYKVWDHCNVNREWVDRHRECVAKWLTNLPGIQSGAYHFGDINQRSVQLSRQASERSFDFFSLTASLALSLLRSLIGAHPNRSQYGRHRADSLNPRWPVKVVGVRKSSCEEESDRCHCSDAQKSAISNRQSNGCVHLFIFENGYEVRPVTDISQLGFQQLNRLPQPRRCLAVVPGRQALVREVFSVDHLRPAARVAEPVAIGIKLSNAPNEISIQVARLPVVRVVDADNCPDAPVEVATGGGELHRLVVQLRKLKRPTIFADNYQLISMSAYRTEKVTAVLVDFWLHFFKVKFREASFAFDHCRLRMKRGIVA